MVPIPTLNELYTQVLSDIQTELSVQVPFFGKNFLRAIAAVQAAKLKLYYLALANVQKNVFPDTAESTSIGGTLERFGSVKLGRLPFNATPGTYLIEVVGTDGAVIPANTTFKSDDDSLNPSIIYNVDNDYTLVTPYQLEVRALTPGLEGQLYVGDTMTLTGPIALVDDIATIVSEVVEPKVSEDLEDYRRKIIESYRLEAQGGSASDYRIWSSDAQGVEQVYPYTQQGVSNGVDLYIEATESDSSDGKGTPTPAIIQDVEDVIELPTVDRPSRKPITDDVNYLPVVPLDVEIEITSFSNLTPTIQNSIEDSIRVALSKVRPFVDSIDVVADKNDSFGVNNIIQLILDSNPGSSFGNVEMKVDGTVLNSFVFDFGNIPSLLSVTYV